MDHEKKRPLDFLGVRSSGAAKDTYLKPSLPLMRNMVVTAADTQYYTVAIDCVRTHIRPPSQRLDFLGTEGSLFGPVRSR